MKIVNGFLIVNLRNSKEDTAIAMDEIAGVWPNRDDTGDCVGIRLKHQNMVYLVHGTTKDFIRAISLKQV